jgi:MOSC domain-containing protein YiiM
MPGVVISVGRSAQHAFSKPPQDCIRLLAGLGVEDDAHQGVTVKHRTRVRKDPTQANLRQVHLIHTELFTELKDAGFSIGVGDLGENITTRGLDLHGLPTGTRLHVGDCAIVELTGLRSPCRQIEAFAPGLVAQVTMRDGNGNLTYKVGVMSIVIAGGDIRAGDEIRTVLPPMPHVALKVV